MKKLDWRALCLCGFWLLLSSCASTDGRSAKPQPLTITSAALPQAVQTEVYRGGAGFPVTAAGGVPPYHWTWAPTAGSTLPPGMRLSSNSDGTGTLLGTPIAAGPYQVIVMVTDSESPARQKSQIYIITVVAPTPRSRAVTSKVAVQR